MSEKIRPVYRYLPECAGCKRLYPGYELTLDIKGFPLCSECYAKLNTPAGEGEE